MTVNLSRMLTRNRWRRPAVEALVDGNRRLSHRTLDDRVHAVAAGLQDLGVERGTLVGILAPNRAEYVIAVYALARLGAISVPINTRLHAEELAWILDHVGASVLLTDGPQHDVAEAVAAAVPSLNRVVTMAGSAEAGWECLADLEEAGRGRVVPDADVGPDDVQRVLYTSGTTSRPKGVTITHGNAVFNHMAQITELELGPWSRFLLSTPLYHVSSMDGPGLSTLYAGGAVVSVPTFDPDEMLRVVEEERITGMILPYPVIRGMTRSPLRREVDTSSVRWIVMAGVPVQEIEEFRAEVFSEARMVEALGMTEYTSGVAYLDAAHERTKAGSAGTAVHHADVRVVDDDGAPVQAGEVGEFVVRGPKITPGYWRDRETTARALRDGWFHTGDMGRMDEDGFLWFVDRKKDMIRSGGENIASAEVERVLHEHPDVVEAAVAAVPDERWTEVPKAWVVPRAGASLTDELLIEHCRAHLARFKVPKYFDFVDDLPRNHSGKVLKRVLRDESPGDRAGSAPQVEPREVGP